LPAEHHRRLAPETPGAAAEGHPSEVMDMSFSGQLMALIYLAKNKFGNEVYGETDFIDNILGLKLESLSEKQKNKYQINYGVSILEINNTSFSRHGIKEGAIILGIERQKIMDVADVEKLMRTYENKEYVTLQILNTNNKVEYVSLKL